MEWLAATCSHIPNRGEQMLRYYGYYSNVSWEVMKATLKQLGLWLVKSKPTPKAPAPPALSQNASGPAGYLRDPFSQLPMNDDHLYQGPEYSWDEYIKA